jgi:hypothetical protein
VIIACPECTQPFQVEDGDIAPLVQIECPHCAFRMILDFEAANDASLIEAGMQMAQGFFSEAEYRSAVGGGSIASQPFQPAETSSPAARLHAVPEPEPTPEVEPTPELATAPRSRVPRTQPPSEKPPVRLSPTPEIEPEFEPEIAPEPEPDKPPVRMSRATFEPAPEPTPPKPSRARPTLIAHTAPPPALRPPGQSGAGVPLNVDEPGTPVPIDREVDVEVEFDEPQPSPDARHSPPHTPPVLAPMARPELEEPTHPAADSQSRPVASREAEPVATTEKKPSVAATVLKVILLLLLLAIAGVMVWSLIETGNPNPLPMLQERLGMTPPAAAPVAPET